MTRKSTINRLVFLSLPLCGIWPGRSSVLITRVFWIVTVAFIECCLYAYFSSHLNSQNFFNLVDCLCSFLAHLKVITKLVVLWVNQRTLMETFALITDDWRDTANFGDIGVRVTTSKAKISDRITKTIFFLHTMEIVSYCLGVIIADADITDPTIEISFINKLILPFSINTRCMYRIVLIVEFVHMILCNWTAGVANSILLTLVLHVGGQIEILNCRLMQLTSKESKNQRESIVTAMRKIILKHQGIIHFSENIECLYTYAALLLFASNSILICSLGFLIVTAMDSPDTTEKIIHCLLFFISTNVEAFIFCYAGEYLSNKSKTIVQATYDCAWYNLTPTDSRVLLLITLRSQKQLTLTVGKVTDLSLETFASIMNASGSYLSVLLAMQ